MSRQKISQKDFVKMLWLWLGKHINSKEINKIAEIAKFPLSFFRPKQKLHLINESLAIYLYLIRDGCKIFFNEKISLRNEILDEFHEEVYRKIISPVSDTKDIQKDWYAEIGKRYAGYDEVFHLEGMQFGGKFLSNLFNDPKKMLDTLASFRLESMFLNSLNALLGLLKEFEIIEEVS